MPFDLGEVVARVGQAMLILAGLLTLAGLLISVPRMLRVRRRLKAVSARALAGSVEIESLLTLLAEHSAETERLLRPLRRLQSQLSHPLLLALVQSYLRRQRASAG
jgi:hypothetical protein